MPMSIKEHIEAEHYEKDAKGRALVPLANGETATIYATDHTDGDLVIVGRIFVAGENRLQKWDGEGRINRLDDKRLWLCLPPPRRVPVLLFLVKSPNTECGPFERFDDAERERKRLDNAQIVSLRGEYLEAWS